MAHELKELEEVTHQPQISMKSHKIAIQKNQSGEPIENRLISQGREAEKKKQVMKEQKQQQTEELYSYKPDIEVS